MKNKTKRIITISCAILLIVMIQMIGVTYAKYITTERGTGSANIAKWGFEIVKNGTQTKTVSLVNRIASSSMKTGEIAPGSSGTITIVVDAKDSEVDVDYALDFSNEVNKPQNMIFTYNNVEYSSLADIPSIKGTIKHDNTSRTQQLNVRWEWPYQSGESETEQAECDILDTQDSQKITQYTFDIQVTGTQGQ